jgi:hypothetical protein
MGAFYTNVCFKGPSQAQLADYLAERNRGAFVAATVDGMTLVYDQHSDSQDTEVILDFASKISRDFACPALSVLLHDSDIFIFWLHDQGELAWSYNSRPGYFGPQDHAIARQVDRRVLERVWGPPKDAFGLWWCLMEPPLLRRVRTSLGFALAALPLPRGAKLALMDWGSPFEEDVHKGFVEAMGLPEHSLYWGYNTLKEAKKEGNQADGPLFRDLREVEPLVRSWPW